MVWRPACFLVGKHPHAAQLLHERNLAGQQTCNSQLSSAYYNAAQINSIAKPQPRPPLTCTANRCYSMQSLGIIAGSPLAQALLANRLCVNTAGALLGSEMAAFDARVRDWCGEHAGPYLFHRAEDGHLVMGFEMPQIAVHFALAFNGWTDS